MFTTHPFGRFIWIISRLNLNKINTKKAMNSKKFMALKITILAYSVNTYDIEAVNGASTFNGRKE